jgi:hypothetical protein
MTWHPTWPRGAPLRLQPRETRCYYLDVGMAIYGPTKTGAIALRQNHNSSKIECRSNYWATKRKVTMAVRASLRSSSANRLKTLRTIKLNTACRGGLYRVDIAI